MSDAMTLAREAVFEQARALIASGASVDVVRETTGIGRDQIVVLRRTMGLALDKTALGIVSRRREMALLAGTGHSSKQIAAKLKVGEQVVRRTLKAAGVDVPADRAVHNTHRHNATRIVESMLADAENLTADVGLIDFAALDHARLTEWIHRFIGAKRALDLFIRRLTKERGPNGEEAA